MSFDASSNNFKCATSSQWTQPSKARSEIGEIRAQRRERLVSKSSLFANERTAQDVSTCLSGFVNVIKPFSNFCKCKAIREIKLSKEFIEFSPLQFTSFLLFSFDWSHNRFFKNALPSFAFNRPRFKIHLFLDKVGCLHSIWIWWIFLIKKLILTEIR